MGKKCIPGIVCIENMTLFILLFILLIIGYIYYIQVIKFSKVEKDNTKIIIVTPQQTNPLANISTRNDTMNDLYSPPLKNDGLYYPPDSGDIRGLPVNIKTRGLNTNYQQVGILTRVNGGSQEMILPLMGRRIMSGRDKWQYYTMSNTGNLNTKLPVSVNGKSCTGEYGCDSIMNGDTIYVEGYNDTFKATIYENNLFSYIPF
jgi:hypothetical protein